MAECIRTGATVYLEEYDEFFHCDLYTEGNVYIIYGNKLNTKEDIAEYVDLCITKIGFFKHTKPYQIIVVPQRDATMTPRLVKYLERSFP